MVHRRGPAGDGTTAQPVWVGQTGVDLGTSAQVRRRDIPPLVRRPQMRHILNNRPWGWLGVYGDKWGKRALPVWGLPRWFFGGHPQPQCRPDRRRSWHLDIQSLQIFSTCHTWCDTFRHNPVSSFIVIFRHSSSFIVFYRHFVAPNRRIVAPGTDIERITNNARGGRGGI